MAGIIQVIGISKTLIENQDLELMRKLPQEVISKHHSFDNSLAKKYLKF